MVVKSPIKTSHWYARILRSSSLLGVLALPAAGWDAVAQSRSSHDGILGDLLNTDNIELSEVPQPGTGDSNSGPARNGLSPQPAHSTDPQSMESIGQFLRMPNPVAPGQSRAQMLLSTQPGDQGNDLTSHHSLGQTTGHGMLAQADFQAASSGLSPNSAAPSDGNATYQLQYTSMLQFEKSLSRIYGSNLQVAYSEDQKSCRVGMPAKSGRAMIMLMDRQTGQLSFEGVPELRESWYQLMARLDSESIRLSDGSVTQASFFYPVNTNFETIRQTALMLGLMQDDTVLPGNSQDDQEPQLQGQPKGKVQIIQDPNTGLLQLVVEEDADRQMIEDFIKALNEISRGKQKQPKAFPLKNVQASTIEERVKELYDAAYAPSYGTIEVKANSLNNSLVVVGLPDALTQIETIVGQFDTPSLADPTENFRTIKLKFMSAVDAKARLDAYFAQSQAGIGAGEVRLPSIPVISINDFRSNTLAIKGSPQSIKEAELFIAAIDVDKANAEHEVKVIKIRNRLAEDLAVIVQDAINGQQGIGAGNGFKGLQQQQQQQQQQQTQQVDPNASRLGSKSLVMRGVGENGQPVTSGIMFDVRITADRDSNSLIVSAPAISMELIEKLVQELDRVPDVEVQMKVFHVVNGDVVELLTTLNSLFGAGNNQQQGGFGQQNFGQFGQQGNLFNQLPLQTAGSTAGSNLVNLRFSADPRTNTIIATGPVGELQVVEALLNRLDENRASAMQTKIVRLSNAPALDIYDSITSWIAGRDDINSIDPTATGNFNLSGRRVIVVPEVGSNSLIVQARPEYMDEVIEAIKALDRRPPMVKVKVLLAEINLNRLEEFGIDVGVQDSILFDRGTTIGAGNAITGIGFPFNSAAVGNANAFGRENLAGQGLSNLGTGRSNADLGYGGLVLSAGNESINFLLRALENKQCARVLSKPHIMTMENLQGRVQVGANVPRVAGTNTTGLTITQNIEFKDVGVILEVTPRVSPDGVIVLAVNASRSSVGPESTGITIGVGADGTPIRSPQILQATASTTLMARSGQTLVFGGLIQETKEHETRGIPIMSDLPVVGPLFKFESDSAKRTELLIIMTPELVTDDADIARLNQEEIDRMHWCLEDVSEIYGTTGHQVYDGSENAVETIYPHENPTGLEPN